MRDFSFGYKLFAEEAAEDKASNVCWEQRGGRDAESFDRFGLFEKKRQNFLSQRFVQFEKSPKKYYRVLAFCHARHRLISFQIR